jgi:serine/threonine-protein kinase
MKVWRLASGLFALLGFVLGCGAAAWVVLWLSLKTSTVTVPKVEGQPPEAAALSLQKAGLVPRLQAPVPDPTHPPGVVARQKPAAGFQLKRGSPVFLYPSLGANVVPLPDLRGLPEALAVAQLEQMGLQEGSRLEVVGQGSGNLVVAQAPPAATLVAPGSAVSLLLNRGSSERRVVMPDLVGQEAEQAKAWLATWGFRLDGVQLVPYPGLPPQTVVKQTPQAGGPAALGSGVVLWVSR